MPALNNRTAVAVNAGGNARAEVTAQSFAYLAPSTALTTAKAIARRDARAVARSTADNVGLPGTTTTAVANAIAKSIDGQGAALNKGAPINSGSRRRSAVPTSFANGRSDIRGWAGVGVGGNTNVATSNRGLAVALGRTRGAQGSFGGTNNGYFSLNQGIGGSASIATSQNADAIAQSTVRLNSDVGQTVTGDVNVATAARQARTAADSRAKTDFGPAVSGSANVATSITGRAHATTAANRAITRAGPVAVAGSIDVVSAYGDALIGDYTFQFRLRQNSASIDSGPTQTGSTSQSGGQTVSGSQGKLREETSATANTIGDAYAVAIRLANSRYGESNVRSSRGTPAVTAATTNDGNGGAFSLEEVTGFYNAEARASTQTLTTTGNAFAEDVQVLQSLDDTFGNQIVNAEAIEGNTAGIGVQSSTISEYGNLLQQVGSNTVEGNALALGWQSTFAGMTGENAQSVNSGSDRGASLTLATNLVGAALTAEAVTSSAATTQFGTSTAVGVAATAAGMQTQSDAAVASASALGDAYALSVASGLSAIHSQVAAGSAAATEIGNTVSRAIGVATGGLDADSRTTATAGTAVKGNAFASADSLVVGNIFSNSTATAAATSAEGEYVDSKAGAAAIGVVKSTSNARSDAAITKDTGEGFAKLTSEASALSVGFLADATAVSSAKNPENGGLSRANAVALGVVSRVNTGGDSRVAVGPAQSLSGGVSLSAPKAVVAAATDSAAGEGAAAAAGGAASGAAAAGGAAAGGDKAAAGAGGVSGKFSGLVGALRAKATGATAAAKAA